MNSCLKGGESTFREPTTMERPEEPNRGASVDGTFSSRRHAASLPRVALEQHSETMTVYKNKRVLLASRPTEKPCSDNFKIDEKTVDSESLKDGEILIKTEFMSMDPYLILPMGKAGKHADVVPDQKEMHMPQFKDSMKIRPVGEPFGSRIVGRVVASKNDKVAVDEFVAVDSDWQEYNIVQVEGESTFEKLEKDIFSDVSRSTALGLLSVSGAHAWWGFNFLEPKEGKTLVISAAGGNIGIIVAQLAKMKGMKVVGIAGGKEKTEKLKKDLGLDAVVDYKEGNNDVQKLTALIKEAAPSGVDAYFDSVAGPITDAVNNNINENARVYMCGAVSQYPLGGGVTFSEASEKVYKEKNVAHVTCMQADYITKVKETRRILYGFMKEGKLRPIEWITEGIENTPEAFAGMYRGKNYGKTVVKVA